MDIDGRMGGHRWVDLGWVDIGWVDIGWDIGRVRGNAGCDEGEANKDSGRGFATCANASIIPCPLSTPPCPQTGATSAHSLSVVVALDT